MRVSWKDDAAGRDDFICCLWMGSVPNGKYGCMNVAWVRKKLICCCGGTFLREKARMVVILSAARTISFAAGDEFIPKGDSGKCGCMAICKHGTEMTLFVAAAPFLREKVGE